MQEQFSLAARRNPPAFWIGCALVTAGVLLHLPMFLMAKSMRYLLAGMPIDPPMLWGMVLIIAGICAAAYGLAPRLNRHVPDAGQRIITPEDTPLTRAHWLAVGALAIGLIIDVMKPASLGMVTPGMQAEYGLAPRVIAFLPFAALTGTTFGSFVWGALADAYGRRATILLSSVMFVGTSICGAMPSFWWNVVMCFLMGAAAGGMLPVAFSLLAEIMPTKHRGWCLVAVGGIGAVGGYLAASGLAAVLQPIFGWRIMWFLNLPTGLFLVALSAFIPESVQFLMHTGQYAAARATLKKFGAVVVAVPHGMGGEDADGTLPVNFRFLGSSVALSLVALSWGLINFGVLLWLPGELVREGDNMGVAASIIAQSILIATPIVALSVCLYAVWSTKWSLISMLGIAATGLVALSLRQFGMFVSPLVPLVFLIVGSTGVISILLPYAAESHPFATRGRATGWVAGCSKAGGLVCQGLSVMSAVPSLGHAALIFSVPAMTGLMLMVFYGRETRGRDLRQLDHVASRVRRLEAIAGR